MIKFFFGVLYVSLIGSLLMSCSEPEHSIEWYKQHEAERKIMLDKCKSDSNLATKNQNCQNAASAQFRSGSYTPSPNKSWGIENGELK